MLQFTNGEALASFAALTFLEIVLGIDNIVFLAMAVHRLPASRRPMGRRFGLGLAMLLRIAMLVAVVWLARLNIVLFHVLGRGISVKDLVLIGGGLFLLAKAQAHCYIFCDIDWFAAWKDGMRDAGWKVFRTPLIWHKPQGFRAPWPDKGPQRQYETILLASKGDKPVNSMKGDVLTHTPDKNLGHSAQKPVGLYTDLLSRSITQATMYSIPSAAPARSSKRHIS